MEPPGQNNNSVEATFAPIENLNSTSSIEIQKFIIYESIINDLKYTFTIRGPRYIGVISEQILTDCMSILSQNNGYSNNFCTLSISK